MSNAKLKRYFMPPHDPSQCKGFLPEHKYTEDQCLQCWVIYHNKFGPCHDTVTENSCYIESKTKYDKFRYCRLILTGPAFNRSDIKFDNAGIKPAVEVKSAAKVDFCVFSCRIEFFVTNEEYSKISDNDTVEIFSSTNQSIVLPLKQLFEE